MGKFILKLLASIELLFAVILLILVLWLGFLLIMHNSPANEGATYIFIFLIFSAPIMLALFTASIALGKIWTKTGHGGFKAGFCYLVYAWSEQSAFYENKPQAAPERTAHTPKTHPKNHHCSPSVHLGRRPKPNCRDFYR